jgi:uncharacterized protein (TIGR03083 family)
MTGWPELAAFRAECAAIDATLQEVADESWELPALGEWDVAELVAHLVGVVERVSEFLDAPAEPGSPTVDRVEYYRYDPAELAPAVAERARLRAARVPAGTLPALFAQSWREAERRAAEAGPRRPLTTPRGAMHLDEYVATRVLEATVHHIDLCAALGLPPVSTPDAARLTMRLLEGLLGAPKPRNLGRARFIKVATGRIVTDDPRFPVLR